MRSRLRPPRPTLTSNTRRRLLHSAGAGLLALSLPLSAHAAGTFKLAILNWIGYSPFYVAQALDLYKKHGLKVSYQNFADPALIPPALASGAVDAALLTYDQVVGEVAKGHTLRVVMPVDYSAGGDAILAEAGITSVAQLKGKAVAFNPLSPSDFLLSYALSKHGLSEKDVKPINMTPEAVPAAMASGKVPVGVTYEPSVSQILDQTQGKHKVIYSSKDAPGLIADVLVAEHKTIAARSKALQALMRGYMDGLAYIQAKPDEAAKLIGKALEISPEQVKAQLTGVYNIPPGEMLKAFAPGNDTTSYYVSGEVIGRLLLAKGQIKAQPKIEDTFDSTPLRTLLGK